MLALRKLGLLVAQHRQGVAEGDEACGLEGGVDVQAPGQHHGLVGDGAHRGAVHTPEAIRQALFEDFVIEQRQRGVVSLGKAAELLNLTYAELFDLLGNKGLSPINASPQDLDESHRRFSELMEEE